jgi:hypothetical protein
MLVFTQKRILRDEDFWALDLFTDSREGFPVSKASGILAIAAFALVGCVTSEEGLPDPYRYNDHNGGLGKWCRNTVANQVDEVDSIATCSDGTAPRLARVEWLTRGENCNTVEIDDVVGGFSGIRRYFGCER